MQISVILNWKLSSELQIKNLVRAAPLKMSTFWGVMITLTLLTSVIESEPLESRNTQLENSETVPAAYSLRKAEKQPADSNKAKNNKNTTKKPSERFVPSKTKICNGIVIRETAVITAASCVDKLRHAKFLVRSKDGSSVLSAVVNVMPHPMFNKSSQGIFDLAVLQLEKRLHTNETAGGSPGLRLADHKPVKDSVGYMSNCLGRGMEVTVLSKRQCKLQTGEKIGADEFCASAPRPKGKRDCLPATGSPIVIRRTLIGIYNFGFRGKGKLKKVNALFFTSIADHKGWLGDIVAGFINSVDDGIKPNYTVYYKGDENEDKKAKVLRTKEEGGVQGTTLGPAGVAGTSGTTSKKVHNKEASEMGEGIRTTKAHSTENYSTSVRPDNNARTETEPRRSVEFDAPQATAITYNKTVEKEESKTEEASETYQAEPDSLKTLPEEDTNHSKNESLGVEDDVTSVKNEDGDEDPQKEDLASSTSYLPTEAYDEASLDDDDLWLNVSEKDDPFFDKAENFEIKDSTVIPETLLLQEIDGHSRKTQETEETLYNESVRSGDQDRRRRIQGHRIGVQRTDVRSDEKLIKEIPEDAAKNGPRSIKSSNHLLKKYGLGVLESSDENIQAVIEEGLYFHNNKEEVPRYGSKIQNQSVFQNSSIPKIGQPNGFNPNFSANDESLSKIELQKDVLSTVPEEGTTERSKKGQEQLLEYDSDFQKEEETQAISDPKAHFQFQSSKVLEKGQDDPEEHFIFHSPKGTIKEKTSSRILSSYAAKSYRNVGKEINRASATGESTNSSNRMKRKHRLKPKTCRRYLTKRYDRGTLAHDDITKLCSFLQKYN